jgi:hypothetical protein
MDEQNEGVREDGEDVEGHLLKETFAAAAVAGAIFAGSAEARVVGSDRDSVGDKG